MPTHPPEPPHLGADARIVEGIVTTENDDGSINFSPMGPIVDESFNRLWLRPFRTSTTYRNLIRTSVGVFHITDDAELFAQAAVGIEQSRDNGMHALRHWYASVLLDAGESIRAVSEYLGHSDPGFTLRTSS